MTWRAISARPYYAAGRLPCSVTGGDHGETQQGAEADASGSPNPGDGGTNDGDMDDRNDYSVDTFLINGAVGGRLARKESKAAEAAEAVELKAAAAHRRSTIRASKRAATKTEAQVAGQAAAKSSAAAVAQVATQAVAAAEVPAQTVATATAAAVAHVASTATADAAAQGKRAKSNGPAASADGAAAEEEEDRYAAAAAAAAAAIAPFAPAGAKQVGFACIACDVIQTHNARHVIVSHFDAHFFELNGLL